MSDAARRQATYDDVLAAGAHQIAELLGGELHVHPRPASPHAVAATTLGEELGPPFRRGKGGPGGWIILDEPEIHLGADVVVPDLAGWRRTVSSLPIASASAGSCLGQRCRSGGWIQLTRDDGRSWSSSGVRAA